MARREVWRSVIAVRHNAAQTIKEQQRPCTHTSRYHDIHGAWRCLQTRLRDVLRGEPALEIQAWVESSYSRKEWYPR